MVCTGIGAPAPGAAAAVHSMGGMSLALPTPFVFALGTSLTFAALLLRMRLMGAGFFVFFAGILLGIHGSVTVLLYPWMGPFQPIALLLQLSTALYIGALARPRLRGPLWRGLVSLPGAAFVAGSFLSLPWAVAAALGFPPVGWWLPMLAAGAGLYRSVSFRREVVDLVLDGAPMEGPARAARGEGRVERPLRLVQITDPHLGTFMPVERLAALCERAVAEDPDLILLTGDLLTFETNRDPASLAKALEPLAKLPGRVFACLGNHDHEAPEAVRHGLKAAGARLLVDESVVVETPAGPVQILGLDHRWADRGAHLVGACRRNPRIPGVFRLVLLHDPTAFSQLPEGEGDLVLSGHTHGGQVGLVSLGLNWTVVSGLFGLPDHGFWGRGRDRMWVHRGSGHYGFPLRVGVPAEESVLRIHRLH